MSDSKAQADIKAKALIAKHGPGKALVLVVAGAFLKIGLGLLGCVAIGGVVALTIRAVMFGWGLVW